MHFSGSIHAGNNLEHHGAAESSPMILLHCPPHRHQLTIDVTPKDKLHQESEGFRNTLRMWGDTPASYGEARDWKSGSLVAAKSATIGMRDGVRDQRGRLAGWREGICSGERQSGEQNTRWKFRTCGTSGTGHCEKILSECSCWCESVSMGDQTSGGSVCCSEGE